jgi:hypothetical protein
MYSTDAWIREANAGRRRMRRQPPKPFTSGADPNRSPSRSFVPHRPWARSRRRVAQPQPGRGASAASPSAAAATHPSLALSVAPHETSRIRRSIGGDFVPRPRSCSDDETSDLPIAASSSLLTSGGSRMLKTTDDLSRGTAVGRTSKSRPTARSVAAGCAGGDRASTNPSVHPVAELRRIRNGRGRRRVWHRVSLEDGRRPLSVASARGCDSYVRDRDPARFVHEVTGRLRRHSHARRRSRAAVEDDAPLFVHGRTCCGRLFL